MAVADRHGLPVTVCTESATPHEVKLVMQTLAEIFVEEAVQRLIGDNACDSDQLDREPAETGVEMIAPHRSNGTNRTQDGRVLRRYRHRWKIDRLFASAPELSPAGHALRVLFGELHGHAPSRLCTHPAPPVMRWVLS